ncbi:MAG: leucyl aminopeptidase family protein [Legionellaceae bacterium]|nr:leucyl aminopeptidase family protein [Legionellaceae bacterium]
MQAQAFYQTDAEQTISLVLLASIDQAKSEDKPALKLQQFHAKPGEWAVIGDANHQILTVYVGLGKGTDFEAIAHVVTQLPAGCYWPEQALSSRAEVMWSLAQYKFDKYKSSDKQVPKQLLIQAEALPAVLAEAEAVFLVRDLINTPANHMGPEALAQAVEDLADMHGAQFDACVGEDLLEENYPAIHAVGRAASEAPRLASLTWGDPKHPRVALVGKGVCFDSGGLDLKPSRGMRLMKKDMGGAANAIGLAHWIMSMQLPICLQLLIPAVENAVSASAYRPGDVLTMRNGLTVEIDNTDAEGRLVLADALVKACEYKPDLVIDLATLTGAARIAVGTEITAMFTNDDELAADVSTASEIMGDPVWRLPLHQGYTSLFDSSIADLANSAASGYGGAITAALFLERFITPQTSWMHGDLMAWNIRSKPGKPEGGEAMGIQALFRYLAQQYI